MSKRKNYSRNKFDNRQNGDIIKDKEIKAKFKALIASIPTGKVLWI